MEKRRRPSIFDLMERYMERMFEEDAEFTTAFRGGVQKTEERVDGYRGLVQRPV